VPLPDPGPGKTVDASVDLKAPQEPGTYKGQWRTRLADGTYIGDSFWVAIVVASTESVPKGEKGTEFTAKDQSGDVRTWSQPCGSAIPAGATCTCNCVTVPAGCSCVGDTGCSCVGKTSGGGVCAVVYHYWHPN
jgi:hypothetical protein